MFICKIVKDREPKLKFFFDELLSYEDCMKVDITDVENKIKDHQKGYIPLINSIVSKN